jgi:hypothetical protein
MTKARLDEHFLHLTHHLGQLRVGLRDRLVLTWGFLCGQPCFRCWERLRVPVIHAFHCLCPVCPCFCRVPACYLGVLLPLLYLGSYAAAHVQLKSVPA